MIRQCPGTSRENESSYQDLWVMFYQSDMWLSQLHCATFGRFQGFKTDRKLMAKPVK